MFKIQSIALCCLALFTASAAGADAAKDEVTKAAKALAEKSGYSWTTTVTVPSDARFRPGPTEGQKEKDGPMHLKMIFNDTTTEVFVKGQNIAIKGGADSAWQTASELENEEGFRRFLAARMRNYKAPAEQAQEVLADLKDLKKEGDVYSGELTDEGTKKLLTFRRGGDSQVSNPKGSAKFWVKDGVLSKYEYKVKGSVSFNGNDIDIDRTTTTVIKDAGETKITIPEAAQKKLS